MLLLLLISDCCSYSVNSGFNNPAFTHTYEDGKKENVFIALPTLAIMTGKGDNGKFIVSNAD